MLLEVGVIKNFSNTAAIRVIQCTLFYASNKCEHVLLVYVSHSDYCESFCQ
jgi:hypothetical protein